MYIRPLLLPRGCICDHYSALSSNSQLLCPYLSARMISSGELPLTFNLPYYVFGSIRIIPPAAFKATVLNIGQASPLHQAEDGDMLNSAAQ